MKLMPVPNICGRFLQFLDGTAYPCVGAKSVSARGSIETHEFNELGERENDQPLLDGLSRFVAMVEGSACSPRSGLSISGHPFFLIGLHPHATRPARRFSHPVMVFKSHRQFENLGVDGRFEKLQAAKRSRDIELQGSVNPDLAGCLARAGTANRNAHDDERP